jgi:hypothetical protein
VAQGFDDQPRHREAFGAAIATLGRRKDRLVRRQQILKDRDERVLVVGEPDARPMGYGHSPKMPCYNMQSVVDVDSGLTIHRGRALSFRAGRRWRTTCAPSSSGGRMNSSGCCFWMCATG